MTRRIHLDFLGCRLNQAEIERMARDFTARGDTVVDSAEEADLVVINTCAVTRNAGKASRKLIRGAARANPEVEIVATGCYAHIAPEKVSALPNVMQVVGNFEKDHLVPLINGDDPAPAYEREPIEREPLPPGTLGRTRAFLKVQDGCDNRCTFCVTTLARGEGRSRPLEDILTEVQELIAVGYKEIVLTGVHLGSYGHARSHDHGDEHGLFGLVRAILHRTEVPRLRLSSLEPWDLTPEFFTLWQDSRLCPHLHLPLQSGCDATLRRMARKTSQAQFSALVEAARTHIPDLAITTDVIVGFPGETDEEFAASLDFVRRMDFARLHCFPYSARPGTAAARMPGQLPKATKKARMQQMLALSAEGWRRFRQGMVGQTTEALWESAGGATSEGLLWSGHTPNYVRVEAAAPGDRANTLSRVHITGLTDDGLRGTILEESPH